MEDLSGLDIGALAPDHRALIEEYLATKEGILSAVQRGDLSTYTPYPHQLAFHRSLCTTRALLGANKIGKSTAIEQEVRWFCEGNHPYRKLPGPAKLIWCCCPTEELMMMYQLPGIRRALGEGNIREIKMGAHPRILHKSGTLILFKYYAQGARAFPTASVDLVVLDEEPPWPIMEEIWLRRGTGELNIVMGNTMVFGLTWVYEKIIKREFPDCDFWTAALDENPAIPEIERQRVKQGLKSNPVMYRIRVLGEILPIDGAGRFDLNSLDAMWRQDVREPKARFDFDYEDQRWIQTEMGRLWVWELPEPGHEYAIGADIAEGLNVGYSDSEPVWDETALRVMHRTYRRISAEYVSGDEEPGLIGEHILPRLSSMYNNSWANVEINNHGHTVVFLARKKMSNRLWSPPEDRTKHAQAPTRQFGSLTTPARRRFMIDQLAQAIHERDIEDPSGRSVQQMMGFIKKPGGKVEHKDGHHDDLVIATALLNVMDRDLPAPRITKPPSVRDELRRLALENPKRERKVQWFRRIA